MTPKDLINAPFYGGLFGAVVLGLLGMQDAGGLHGLVTGGIVGFVFGMPLGGLVAIL
jgi:hypothetical protein